MGGEINMNRYQAKWFRDTKGNYLNLERSDRSVKEIMAVDIEAAIEAAKEMEHEDSMYPFTDRVSVYPV